MKLKFDPSLDYQQDAINAVVDVFAGQASPQNSAAAFQSLQIGGMFEQELGVGNLLTLPDDVLLANVHTIQEANAIEKVPALQGRHFSIEMETGTGKTYVYLRTVFELNKRYGFRKFIIVVPSVAVREGVLKSITIMKDHFRTLYDMVPFDYFVYDSKKLAAVREFCGGNHIKIMVINIQAFVKDFPDQPQSETITDTTKQPDQKRADQKRNVINRENDRMSGRKPIEFIQATRPLVIIDEPQSVDNTQKAQDAIKRLNPSATLRYSATHRNPYNLLYKLDPIKAYDLRLVKRIEVASVRTEDHFNDAFVRLLQTDNTNGIRARVEIHKEGAKGPKPVRVWVRQGDDLFVKSGQRAAYENGYIIQNIDCTPGAAGVELTSGHWLALGHEIGGLNDDIMKRQVFETVEQHLKKERAFQNKGIKPLSLFFIDTVANYRIYHDDGSTGLGKIGRWFEDAFCELIQKPAYKGLIPHAVTNIHNGYFSRDKKGRVRDTRGNTRDDEETYHLIMRDKEKLLDQAEPLRFIFSHSALREGWDNPNVFQICTLNETRSPDKKRQEIGRGLRLAVNQEGHRIHDENINRLTVIANQSYEEFARTLQSEFEEEYGIRFGRVEKIAFSKLVSPNSQGVETEIGQATSTTIWQELVDHGYLNEDGEILDSFDPKNPDFKLKISAEFVSLEPEITDIINQKLFKNRIPDAREKRLLTFHKQVYLDPEFEKLWQRISQRTRYRVRFNTDALIEKAARRIKNIDPIKPVRITTTRAGLDITEAGVDSQTVLEQKSFETQSVAFLPDILAFLQKETELTRHTLVQILQQSGRLAEFQINPQSFMEAVTREISRALRDLMLDGIQYEKITDQRWDMARIEKDAAEEIQRYLDRLYTVKNTEKTLFNAIECDSEVERRYARELDNDENVRLFVKLPGWFVIDTPIGPYNPDWAFVAERDESLYFVRETKSSTDRQHLRTREDQKIAYGQKHFKTIGVDYALRTSLREERW